LISVIFIVTGCNNLSEINSEIRQSSETEIGIDEIGTGQLNSESEKAEQSKYEIEIDYKKPESGTKIIKVYKQSIPAMRFIGKKYSNIGGNWGEWWANSWFDVIEETASGSETVHGLYEDGDAYLEMKRIKSGESTEYWIGMFTAPDTEVPDGFLYVDFPASNLGVCWLYGGENAVYGMQTQCLNKILDLEMKLKKDENDARWYIDRYQSPRFTNPDENGNIILDYCFIVE
jgi:hypothetical protein